MSTYDLKEYSHVQYQYFIRSGEQKSKVLEGTLKSIITKMKRHLDKVELYEISHISLNLQGYDWSQHGEKFEGWSK